MGQQTEINIIFDEQGNTSVEVSGHVGPGCSDLTKKIEAALGSVANDEKKPDYFKRGEQHVSAGRK